MALGINESDGSMTVDSYNTWGMFLILSNVKSCKSSSSAPSILVLSLSSRLAQRRDYKIEVLVILPLDLGGTDLQEPFTAGSQYSVW